MLGIIGGTGLYQMEELAVITKHQVKTPFGSPSDEIIEGAFDCDGKKISVFFLPRHGKNHGFLPHEVNYRANIWALKSLGVTKILSISAVGSLQQEIAPGHLVIPDQYFDFTKGRRASTFLGDGLTAHVSTAKPTCPIMTELLPTLAEKVGATFHTKKSYACVEGPRFGTKTESFFLKNAGNHIVGMTNVPEAFLAREAQICYSTLAVATDYDCWLDDPSTHVSMDKVIALYQKTLATVKQMLPRLAKEMDQSKKSCSCHHSLEGAVMAHREDLKPLQQQILDFLLVRP